MIGHERADRILIRGKDIGLIIGILTLCTMVWGAYRKPAQWDQAVDDLRTLKPTVAIHTTQLAVVDSKLDQILSELRDIKSDMRRQKAGQ